MNNSNSKRLIDLFENKPCENNYTPKGLPDDVFSCFGKLSGNQFIKDQNKCEFCNCNIDYSDMINIKTLNDIHNFACSVPMKSPHEQIVGHMKLLWLFCNSFMPIGHDSFRVKEMLKVYFKNALNTMYKNNMPHYVEMKMMYDSVYFEIFIPTKNCVC